MASECCCLFCGRYSKGFAVSRWEDFEHVDIRKRINSKKGLNNVTRNNILINSLNKAMRLFG